MNHISALVTAGVGVLAVLHLLTACYPTVGYSGVLTSYLTAVKYLFYARELLQEGYDKYRGEAFKVATMARWIVVVSGPQMVDDIRKANDEQMSFREAVAETIQTDYMIGPQIRLDPYHIGVVRTPLTRNLAARFSDIKDEIAAAFADLIPLKEHDWSEVPAYKTIVKTVVRTSNRLFVGLPLCRNPDYQDLQEEFTFDVVKGSKLINMFPPFLRPVPAKIRRAVRHLGPLIEERIAQIAELGPDYPEKPNDLISWFLEYAEGYQRTPRDLSIRILSINFAAIHTTSMAFTHILYDLAVYTQYVPTMREEVEAVIAEDGWTKVSMGKMRKLDSFIKESSRLAGAAALLMNRKIVRDFTFSNGLFIPAGTHIAVASYAMHHDEELYPASNKFDGFRFLEMRDGGEGDNMKHQMVSLALDYIAFGHGRHACPGRFFAVNELKAMLAYVLLHYDVKLPTNNRPPDLWFEQSFIPNPKAKVMFRKRYTE
ncbi:cytochrome P450 [Cyathus striatus]|nr:cytochrome P450 [Cyathus striatus]